MRFRKIFCFCTIILLFGCRRDKEKVEIQIPQINKSVDSTVAKKDTNILPKLKPVLKATPYSASYIEYKKRVIDDFYQKNWGNTFNGGFLVAQGGCVIFEKYNGYANFKEKKIITPETPIHIASISKVVTATAILMLVEAKKINLDQKVFTILPDFPYSEVSVRMLLNHRSGLPDYDDFTQEKTIWDNHNILTNQNILELLCTKDIPLNAKPNTKFEYCNTNYAVLALIIEKITNKSYKKSMQEMIFEPLEMNNTFVFDYLEDNNKYPLSYKSTWREIPNNYLDAVYGDKNIYSTARDLLKFDNARNSPDFLTPELKKEIYKNYSNERRGLRNYGLGIRMTFPRQSVGGDTLYYHNGWWHGYTASYITLQKESVVFIVISNKFSKKTYRVKKLAPMFGDYPNIKTLD